MNSEKSHNKPQNCLAAQILENSQLEARQTSFVCLFFTVIGWFLWKLTKIPSWFRVNYPPAQSSNTKACNSPFEVFPLKTPALWALSLSPWPAPLLQCIGQRPCLQACKTIKKKKKTCNFIEGQLWWSCWVVSPLRHNILGDCSGFLDSPWPPDLCPKSFRQTGECLPLLSVSFTFLIASEIWNPPKIQFFWFFSNSTLEGGWG